MSRFSRLVMVKTLSPTMANEEKPLPSGTFQSVFGGDFFQSVLMPLSAIMPSRFGPRNPGHQALTPGGGPCGTGVAAGQAQRVGSVKSTMARSAFFIADRFQWGKWQQHLIPQ